MHHHHLHAPFRAQIAARIAALAQILVAQNTT
jgi:hypothetical protein